MIGAGALAAAIYLAVLGLSDNVKAFGDHLFEMDSTPFPSAGGGFGAWLLEASSGGLAGAVEEPVFVGLLVLLWPRLCAAIVDRLTFGGTIIETGTHSYRLAHTRNQKATAAS